MIENVYVGKNYCIEQVIVNGGNIIYPWGAETADAWAFFTQERGGYRHRILEQQGEQGNGFNRAGFIVRMREGKWALKIKEFWGSSTITRHHELVCLENTWCMDFVARYKFRSCVFPMAEIAGQTIEHRDYYRNYTYPVRKVRLFGDRLEALIELLGVQAPDKLTPLMYVRGEGDGWVVHVRLFPAEADKAIIKIVNGVNMATPIPQAISNILLAIPSVRKKIWYAGDKGDWSWPINGLGLVCLPKATVLKLESRVTFYNRKLQCETDA